MLALCRYRIEKEVNETGIKRQFLFLSFYIHFGGHLDCLGKVDNLKPERFFQFTLLHLAHLNIFRLEDYCLPGEDSAEPLETPCFTLILCWPKRAP